MTAFPIQLVFPPQAHFTQPYLALPCIKAWLQQAGFDDVVLDDLAVRSYDRFLSADYLRWAVRRVEARLPLSRWADRPSLPFHELEAYRAAAETAVSGHALVERVEDAKAVLRGEAFYDPGEYVPASRTLYHALRVVSAAWFPSRLTPHNFTMRHSIERSEEVLAATMDEEENPYLSWYREEVLPELVARKPRVLGLSVIYGSQLIPALTLGRLVKEALPDCHVTAGGGFLAYIGDKVLGAPALSRCLDSMIFHEGEKPMQELCEALREHGPRPGREVLQEIGSLGWYDHEHEAGVTGVKNIGAHPISLDDAPTPDFDGLPWDTYFSPEVMLPYDINRGCYYGECSFCTLPTVIGPGYRTRSADTIARQVADLKARYGRSNFTFVTDCLPPGMIAELPVKLIENEVDVRWWCDARVEPRAYTKEGAKTLYDSGCRKLLFGFETAVPRLLKLMKKGQSPQRTLEVANNCNDAGISVTFYAMVGFPSETVEEARTTLEFIAANAAGATPPGPIREVSLQTFHIDEVAEVFRDPETYGIEIVHDDKADLALYHDYKAGTGMSQLEAAEMFDEMMAGLREALPLFHEDTILYFMQKSHYFLHLARDTTPDDFIAKCHAAGLARRARQAEEERHLGDLRTPASLVTVDLPFGYTEAVRRLAHPLARAARPDFLTGTFLPDLEAEAARELGSLTPRPRVLAYAPGATEFVELSPDAHRLLGALQEAGTPEALRDALAPTDAELPADQAAKLDAFLHDLHDLGLLGPTA